MAATSAELDLGPLYDLAAMYRLVHHEDVVRIRDEVLGDSTRRHVWGMADGETTLTAMAQKLGVSQQAVSQQAVSQHAKQLAQRGLIRKLDNDRYQRCLED